MAICRNQTCGKEFKQVKKRHFFCSRKCFIKQYYLTINKKSNPIFLCPSCNTKTRLDFYPIDDNEKWTSFKCPKCGYAVEEIIELYDEDIE